ncbi:hypothetical protein Barb7_00916 [Bacteroidales bacterium Barb7]|nr:hypothetical protein Barb7_00916 [Bacteroidales bacterium Barb7]
MNEQEIEEGIGKAFVCLAAEDDVFVRQLVGCCEGTFEEVLLIVQEDGFLIGRGTQGGNAGQEVILDVAGEGSQSGFGLNQDTGGRAYLQCCAYAALIVGVGRAVNGGQIGETFLCEVERADAVESFGEVVSQDAVQHGVVRFGDSVCAPCVRGRRLKIVTAFAAHFVIVQIDVGIPFVVIGYAVAAFHLREGKPVAVEVVPEVISAVRGNACGMFAVGRVGDGRP